MPFEPTDHHKMQNFGEKNRIFATERGVFYAIGKIRSKIFHKGIKSRFFRIVMRKN